MPELSYTIGVVDLRQDEAAYFSKLSCRTEIRRAEKDGVTVHLYEAERPARVVAACRTMLKELLENELVPYDAEFDRLLEDTGHLLLVAFLGGEPVSFIVVSPQGSGARFDQPAAYLALSATASRSRAHCPNYLLLWEAVKLLKARNFSYFNLGLLEFTGSDDPAVARVAFFKRKWAIFERTERRAVSLSKYLYNRYLKRFGFVRQVVHRWRRRAGKGLLA